MWQDVILTGAQLIFVVSLIPAIIDPRQKPPLLTSIPTTVGLIATTFAYASLSLWWSALVAGFLTAAWGILAFQRFRNGND
jgi:hypothetical protein